MDYTSYAQAFAQNETRFEEYISRSGLSFEAEESSPRALREPQARTCGCHCENATASIWRNWISPACLRCRTGENTASLFIDFRCTKNCYFCFNVNQPEYDRFHTQQNDIVGELERAHRKNIPYDFLALTGGEPLLYKDTVLRFLERARKLYPQTHCRIYTNGDLLDRETACQLASAGLNEIRFSIKPSDVDDSEAATFAAIEQAVGVINDVVIEMPVIPGSLDTMKRIMCFAEDAGVRGINLLEFCFPLHNAEVFARKGFKLRKHPYRYLFPYGYNGGIPIAQSERECMELLQFAHNELNRLGVHYCSVDNRISSQIHLQNKQFDHSPALHQRHPWLAHSASGPYLECARVFGDDAQHVAHWAQESSTACGFNQAVPYAQIPLAAVKAARYALPSCTFYKSISIVERCASSEDPRIVEVGVEPL